MHTFLRNLKLMKKQMRGGEQCDFWTVYTLASCLLLEEFFIIFRDSSEQQDKIRTHAWRHTPYREHDEMMIFLWKHGNSKNMIMIMIKKITSFAMTIIKLFAMTIIIDVTDERQIEQWKRWKTSTRWFKSLHFLLEKTLFVTQNTLFVINQITLFYGDG